MIYTLGCAQNVHESDSLYEKSRQLLYQNPKEAIQINQFLFGNSKNDDLKTKSLLTMAEAELLIGNYQKAIENVFSAWNSNLSNQNQVHFAFVLNELSQELKLDPKEIFSAFNSNLKFNIQPNEFSDECFQNYRWALFFSEKYKWDSANFYTEKLKEFQPYHNFLKAKILSGQNDFEASLLNLKSIEKNVQNIELRKNIDELIADNYLNQNNLDNYKATYFQSIAFKDS